MIKMKYYHEKQTSLFKPHCLMDYFNSNYKVKKDKKVSGELLVFGKRQEQ